MRLSQCLLPALIVCINACFIGCCAVPCGSSCGRAGLAACGGACSEGCTDGSCGSAACGTGCECPGLLHGEIARRFKVALTGGCCVGCGEFYCDEQVNHPPTCDPCGCNGEFTGQSCGPCKPLWQRMKVLMGTPYYANCGCGECTTGCGFDAYASEHHGSGYCSSCRDGVAGVPHGTRLGVAHESHANVVGESVLHEGTTPTPVTKPTSSVPSTPSKPNPAAKLEPVPDPLSDAVPQRSTRTASSGNTSTPVRVKGLR